MRSQSAPERARAGEEGKKLINPAREKCVPKESHSGLEGRCRITFKKKKKIPYELKQNRILLGCAATGVSLLAVQTFLFARATFRLWKHFRPQWSALQHHLGKSKAGWELAHALHFYDLPLSYLLTERGFWTVAWNYIWRTSILSLFSGFWRESTESAHGLHMFYYVPYKVQSIEYSNPTKWYHTGLTQTPWVDPEKLPGVRGTLTGTVEKIRREYIAAKEKTEQEHPDWAQAGKGKGRWIWSELYGVHGWSQSSTTQMPETTSTINTLDVCLNFGFVFFSELLPGSHIQEHTGSSNLRYRVHLGLSVPNSEGYNHITGKTVALEKPFDVEKVCLKAGGIANPWKQDDIFIFDDSFIHEAFNFTSQTRNVLIIDLWHPDLSEEEKMLLSSPLFHEFGRLK